MAYTIEINGFIGDTGMFGGDNFTLKQLNEQLANVSGNEQINVVINSGGGYVSEGFAIYDRLASLPNTVNTTVLGLCGSIATVIAQAGKKGKRKMYQNSDYFIHNPAWTPQSPDPMEAEELKNLAEDLKRAEEKILNFYNTVTGVAIDTLKTKMDAAQTLTSDEAMQLGFIDEIIQTNISATKIYKIAAHVSKTNTAMQTIENKIASMFEGFENKFKEMFKNEATPVEPVQKTELEIANEKIAELTAKLAEIETAKGEAVTQAVAEAKEAVTVEVTEKVTTELTNKFNAEFTAFKSKFFTGDKLNEEVFQIMKDEGNPKEAPLSPIEGYRKRQLEKTNK